MKQDVQNVVVNMLIDLAFMMAGHMIAANAVITGLLTQNKYRENFVSFV